MKIRNGFVSNSSTSSFVIMGFDIGQMPKVIENLRNLGILSEKENENYFDAWEISQKIQKMLNSKDFVFRVGGCDAGLPLESKIIGVLVAESSSDGDILEDDKPLDYYIKKLVKIRDCFDIKGEPRIYTGTRAS